MVRKKTPTLTEAELRLMIIIWKLKKATVNDVVKALPRSHRLAYNTVLTTMRILERKGYLDHKKDGRAHIFIPSVSRDQAQRKVVRHMVRSFFDNSPELLMLSVLENENISPEELKHLKEMIGKSE